MQSGTLIAMLAISALLMIALRNLKLGALSLVPNLLPLIMTLGVWAIIHGNIIFTNAVVSGMVLGIVVDYTIHFLSKYLRARREMGLSTEAAVRSAFTMVGAPIVATSVILVAGFLVLTTSDFAGNSTMAGLTSIAIVLALICDFVLLPALLMWLDNSERKATR
jgi:predicted RND superfamily exporter protein